MSVADDRHAINVRREADKLLDQLEEENDFDAQIEVLEALIRDDIPKLARLLDERARRTP